MRVSFPAVISQQIEDAAILYAHLLVLLLLSTVILNCIILPKFKDAWQHFHTVSWMKCLNATD